jgi:hypothetical protein
LSVRVNGIVPMMFAAISARLVGSHTSTVSAWLSATIADMAAGLVTADGDHGHQPTEELTAMKPGTQPGATPANVSVNAARG